MAAKKIVIFLSSVRPGRFNERVGKFVRQTVEAHGMTPVMLGTFIYLYSSLLSDFLI